MLNTWYIRLRETENVLTCHRVGGRHPTTDSSLLDYFEFKRSFCSIQHNVVFPARGLKSKVYRRAFPVSFASGIPGLKTWDIVEHYSSTTLTWHMDDGSNVGQGQDIMV